MKHTPPKSVWVWHGILPLRLTGQDLALALLLREQPLTAQQLCAGMRKANIAVDLKALGKMLNRLKSHGVITEENGVYSCHCRALDSCSAYTSGQLLDLIGLTQNTVGGRMFFSAVPPISSSSNGGRVS